MRCRHSLFQATSSRLIFHEPGGHPCFSTTQILRYHLELLCGVDLYNCIMHTSTAIQVRHGVISYHLKGRYGSWLHIFCAVCTCIANPLLCNGSHRSSVALELCLLDAIARISIDLSGLLVSCVKCLDKKRDVDEIACRCSS